MRPAEESGVQAPSSEKTTDNMFLLLFYSYVSPPILTPKSLQLQHIFFLLSRIRETPTLSTDVDSRTDTILEIFYFLFI